ncbi:MAG: TIM barrel protein [Bryobacterales bacterium]|nr:TIM barrel protein [Bryobacterales bacterium]
MSLSRRHILSSAVAAAAARGFAAPGASPQNGISLAAWSFSRSFFQGKWKLIEMPGILRDKLGITAIEHVNQFFENPVLNYLQKLNKAFNDAGVKQTILMVDGEGATASPDAKERKLAAVMHRKWIDTAHYLGCHSVRINVYGGADDWSKDPGLVKRAAETIHWMLDYAKGSDLNIIVENHGRASSDPDLLVSLVKEVNHPRFGLLCDLGNWNPGADRYANSKKILPYAKGLSVKGTWGPGTDAGFDAEKLVKVAHDFGYKGWWGLEVTPSRGRNAPALSADEQFALEVRTVLEAKAIVERVVLGKS